MRAPVWLALSVSVFAAAVVTIAPLLVGAARVEVIVVSGLICVGAGGVAMTPLAFVYSAYPDYRLHAGMAMVALRLLVTLGAGMIYQRWAEPPQQAYMTAMVVWYLALLVMETGLTVYLTRRALGSTAGERELIA